MWTERAQAAQRHGELESTESWYAADGQPITLAHLVRTTTRRWSHCAASRAYRAGR